MLLTKVNSTVLRAPTRPPMSKQKWRRRKVPRWRVRCAPHQAIGSLIPPEVCFGTGCLPEDLISRRLSLPATGDRWFESISLQRWSQVRTAIGPPGLSVAPRKQAQAQGDRGFESTSLRYIKRFYLAF